jgi:hypothetical protein
MQLQAFNYTDKLHQVPQATVMFFTALATHYTPTTFVSVPAIRFIFLSWATTTHTSHDQVPHQRDVCTCGEILIEAIFL